MTHQPLYEDRVITYTHCTGGDRFRQRLCDPLPAWAYDVREEVAHDLNSLQGNLTEPVAWRRRIRYHWGECWDYRDDEKVPFREHEGGSDGEQIGEVIPLYAAPTHAPSGEKDG